MKNKIKINKGQEYLDNVKPCPAFAFSLEEVNELPIEKCRVQNFYWAHPNWMTFTKTDKDDVKIPVADYMQMILQFNSGITFAELLNKFASGKLFAKRKKSSKK